MARTANRIFSTQDFEQVLRLTREGRTIVECAAVVDFAPTTLYRALAENDEWRQQIFEARTFAKEQKAERAETITWRVADNDKHPRQWDALSRLLNGFHPDLREQPKQVELSGGDKPVQIESKVVSLAALFQLAEDRGVTRDLGFDRPERALPAAQDVRPAPSE